MRTHQVRDENFVPDLLRHVRVRLDLRRERYQRSIGCEVQRVRREGNDLAIARVILWKCWVIDAFGQIWRGLTFMIATCPPSTTVVKAGASPPDATVSMVVRTPSEPIV